METTQHENWYWENQNVLRQGIERMEEILECYVQGKPPSVRELEPLPPSSTLAQLCDRFNLSPFERDIILLCVGMEIQPHFYSLCAKAQGNPQKNYLSFGLILSACPHAQWRVLSPQSSLHRWQLIKVAPGISLTQAAIHIDRRILCYLLGEPATDERLTGWLYTIPQETLAHSPLPPSRAAIAEQIAATWSNPSSNAIFPLIQLCGYDSTAKYEIAQDACDRLNFTLIPLSASNLPSSAEELYQLRQHWEREAILSNGVLFIECDGFPDSDRAKETTLVKFIEQFRTPAIVSSEERKTFRHRNAISFDIRALPHTEKRHLWEMHLGEKVGELNGHLEPLIAQFNLDSQTIRGACASMQHPEIDIKTQLWEFCRLQARPRLDDLAQRIESSATWDDLVLPEREKKILRDVSAQVKQRFRVYEEWGFSGKGRRGLGISALFAGVSGTGKTMASEVIAKEFHLDLYRIDLSAVVSKYIGETEKNLRRIFDAAEAGGAVLLFDEADALFGKRTQVKDSHDRHANIEVSYLLQRMEAYQGLAILTTNLKDSLDEAFMRRIRFILNFPFPKANARSEIWRRIFPQQTPTQGLDYRKLGQLSVSGGNIRSIALNAAFLAANAGESVMMKHIKHSAQTEYLKLGRSLTGTEIQGWV
ncbi:ATP-binding protein [Roseofilum casamattae]|uniref:ATP-binding protein n=1 Tax=Roseofilum casamattae BLCC-M143 TaxID=3022442 RepID=A0ABT7BZ99_9CYAN|nr:ATP-binding protein [Roseofilum casamattae]MDJ1184530.1 ATP-binding protein [Roseofilum casamattae BLCC-M143]